MAALLLFCNCTRLYTVIVQVTWSVSPETMLVDEKVFSKTITPLADAVKRPDFWIAVSVHDAVNVFITVYAAVAALVVSFAYATTGFGATVLARPLSTLAAHAPLVYSPVRTQAAEPDGQSVFGEGIATALDVRAIHLVNDVDRLVHRSVRAPVFVQPAILQASQSIPPMVIEL